MYGCGSGQLRRECPDRRRSCLFPGCTDPTALNYDPAANFDAGCILPLEGCTDLQRRTTTRSPTPTTAAASTRRRARVTSMETARSTSMTCSTSSRSTDRIVSSDARLKDTTSFSREPKRKGCPSGALSISRRYLRTRDEDKKSGLRAQLDAHHEWPSEYMFKFIAPTRRTASAPCSRSFPMTSRSSGNPVAGASMFAHHPGGDVVCGCGV